MRADNKLNIGEDTAKEGQHLFLQFVMQMRFQFINQNDSRHIKLKAPVRSGFHTHNDADHNVQNGSISGRHGIEVKGFPVLFPDLEQEGIHIEV